MGNELLSYMTPVQELTELQPCDILVKPNHNWLPGTTWVPGGASFGHAVIVTEGASHSDIDSLLHNVVVLESHSRDVPEAFQVRKVHGIVPGDDFRYANDTWIRSEKGHRYLLRLGLNGDQKRDILQFLEARLQDRSSWRASKIYEKSDSPVWSGDSLHASGGHSWYCSLLIWQAFYSVLGLDLDANAGPYVFPNDLVNSAAFDHAHASRVRF